MDNYELLILAAKAADIWDTLDECEDGFEFRGSFDLWNPLEDDGDSRRLEVGLRMTVCQHDRVVTAHVGQKFLGQVDIKHCRYDATRLAVLLCAAEIGKAMNEH